MSISTPSTSSTSSSAIQVSSLNSSSPLQITGLASGLDTNSIISELMSIAKQPVTQLQNQVTAIQGTDSTLHSIQSALQTLANNAQALSSTTLFSQSQTVTSTDSSLVAASTTANVGAVVGAYQIQVSALATAAQATYSFQSPTSADTVTVTPSTSGQAGTPQTYSLAAGATAQDLVNAVNADPKGSVWGTVVNGNIVFSDRTTGTPSTFAVSDSANALAQQSSVGGTDASFTINGSATPVSSPSNTVTNAIPGVTLTLGGVTSGAGVNVTVGAPSVSSSQIQSAIQTFVTSYNAAVSQIQTALSTSKSSSDPSVGGLYGDPELNGLLSSMRQAMYASGQGLPTGMASMLDIGVGTGATTGTGALNRNAISGNLTLDATALTNAIQSNPSGVTAVLKSWSQSFSALVNTVGQPGGTIDSRVNGDSSEISDLNNQIANMQSALADKQKQLTQQFAALEGALSQNQSTSSWLTSQLASLPVA